MLASSRDAARVAARATGHRRVASALEPGQRGPTLESHSYALRQPPAQVRPLPLDRRLNTGSEGNERATEAIKTCAVTRSAAPLAWRDASFNPFVAPPRVVQEREIPADVQGCCCGADP